MVEDSGGAANPPALWALDGIPISDAEHTVVGIFCDCLTSFRTANLLLTGWADYLASGARDASPVKRGY